MAVLKISDTVNFRFGAVLQPTFEALQDANSEGYSQNWYLRRARFNVLGTLGNGVTVFFQTDDPRVGNAAANGAKNINTGFLIQDAYAQWAFGGKAIAVQAGLFLVPTIRQVLTSVATFLALDLPTWSQQEGAVELANGGRDYGLGFNGSLLDDHLSYRVGVFSGYRDPTSPQLPPLGAAAGSRNPPRIAGRIMYDFFDPEVGYTYAGTNLGKKKVLAIGFVGDGQGDYKGLGGDAFFDWPLGPGALTAEVDYMHFTAHTFSYLVGGVPTTLPEQETFYTNVGYYFSAAKVQPFFRFETLDFDADANEAKEQKRVGGGLLVQTRDNAVVDDMALKTVTKRAPTERELADLRFAFRVAKHVKSNAIVYAKDLSTVGIGAGQMSRIDSARIAAQKALDSARQAKLSAPLTKGSVVASDAFFPFADGLEVAIEAGCTAVIQPGGSMRDDEVIKAADAKNIAMVFTGTRHFRH